jgi:hypothetical protein
MSARFQPRRKDIVPKSAEAIAALAALRAHEGVQPSPPLHPAYGRIPGYPYAAEEAVWKVWDAKRAELNAEWDRVWAIERTAAAVAAKEAAEHKRIADEEAAERKRADDEEAAILAEAKRRLAEEAKEQRILAMMAELRAK